MLLRSFLKCIKSPWFSPVGFVNFKDESKLWTFEGFQRHIFVVNPSMSLFDHEITLRALLIRGRFAPCEIFKFLDHLFSSFWGLHQLWFIWTSIVFFTIFLVSSLISFNISISFLVLFTTTSSGWKWFNVSVWLDSRQFKYNKCCLMWLDFKMKSRKTDNQRMCISTVPWKMYLYYSFIFHYIDCACFILIYVQNKMDLKTCTLSK